MYVFIYLFIHAFIHLSVFPSICLSIFLSLIYNYMSNIMFTRLPHYEDACTHPIAVTVHGNSRTLYNHYLFLCVVQPSLWPASHIIHAIHKTHFLSLVTLSLHSQLSTPVLFPLVTVSPFLGSVNLLLFCSFSFALFLCFTDEWNYLVLVFLLLAYFTERNTL